ncbi:Uncharacterised protein [Yersinia enterocolitica]|nr:Uncharacterised protein [Yersinia enterocolitica]
MTAQKSIDQEPIDQEQKTRCSSRFNGVFFFCIIPVILQAACALVAFVTRPVHGTRLCEAAASSVQICSGQICHPNHLLV